MKDCNGDHQKVVLDRFSKIPGVSRYVPGDCYCLDCKEPLPYWWNGGNPSPVEEQEQNTKERK